ncbi:MAG: phosphate uptake regulator, PhoU [Thermoleophilia bacterium]|nr:phosphate uptake regulator, PhoU [Thermoleophilia bacterium]
MMMRNVMQEELQALEEALQVEGRLVLEAIGLARTTLVNGDRVLAEKLIDFDEQVDLLYLQVEQGIETLLARQTPVAGDLRLVLAMLHINLHLERMADYCVTIAKLVSLSSELRSDDDLTAKFDEMAERASDMLEVAMGALRERDQQAAESLVEMDGFINRHNRKVVERVMDLGVDPEIREWGLRMVLVSRCLERIGDHVVDVGERTAYLVSGEFREFTDASE